MKKVWVFGLISIGIIGCTAIQGNTAVSTNQLPLAAPVVEDPTLMPTAPPLPTATPMENTPATKSVATQLPPTTTSEPTPLPIATPIPSPTPSPSPTPLPGIELFTFTEGEPGWYTVDDDVMGGISDSYVTFDSSDTTMRFYGTMSLDNNGGFSSVRSDWTPINISQADGVLIRVFGDGQTYRFRVRSATTGAGISYNALFATVADSWQTIYIPFDEMVPTYRGFVMDVGQLDTANIGSFGFMLSDKQPGSFELHVDWIRAVSTPETADV